MLGTSSWTTIGEFRRARLSSSATSSRSRNSARWSAAISMARVATVAARESDCGASSRNTESPLMRTSNSPSASSSSWRTRAPGITTPYSRAKRRRPSFSCSTTSLASSAARLVPTRSSSRAGGSRISSSWRPSSWFEGRPRGGATTRAFTSISATRTPSSSAATSLGSAAMAASRARSNTSHVRRSRSSCGMSLGTFGILQLMTTTSLCGTRSSCSVAIRGFASRSARRRSSSTRASAGPGRSLSESTRSYSA